jgi:hypothetical protein
MSRKLMTRFPVGTFAASKTHQQFVRVLRRRGKAVTVTPAVFTGGDPLPKTVTDEDLLTLKEFEGWAAWQTWYVPPTPVSQDVVLATIRGILDRIQRD